MYLCTFLSCKAELFFTKKYIYLNFCINAKITKNSASMAKQKKNCLCMNFPNFLDFSIFLFFNPYIFKQKICNWRKDLVFSFLTN